MIFLSHNSKDKHLVDTIAQKLSVIFGRDKIFYDSWSIQPGDGIVDKMNTGLQGCKFFFLFSSKNSLTSNWVTKEWQAAFWLSINSNIRFVPVNLDNTPLPAILKQTCYIDTYSQGLEPTLTQMIQIINGENTYQPLPNFSNIKAHITTKLDCTLIEFKAHVYMEPLSRYAILHSHEEDDISCELFSGGVVFPIKFAKDLALSNGKKANAFFINQDRPTLPGFPVIVKLSSSRGKSINILGAMKATSFDQYELIPIE